MVKELDEIVEPLLKWYEQNKRTLPWRTSKNPYFIWISEIMLQQTRVETVKEYYLRFTRELPTVKALAEVSDERLLKLWEGLGYYSRARNLKKSANIITEKYQGFLPNTYEELMSLPGIGAYTAGAIASIAYQICVPAIDGNVLRVLSRLLKSERDVSQKTTFSFIFNLLSSIIPAKFPGEFNQALMELGATICLPRTNPQCKKCPIANYCLAYYAGNPIDYPIKKQKKERRIEEMTVFIIEADDKYLLHKRSQKGLLAGMWEFPNDERILSDHFLYDALLDLNIYSQRILDKKFAKHIFSHIEWHMHGFFVKAKYQENIGKNYRWMTLEEIENTVSIPSAFSYFLDNLRYKK